MALSPAITASAYDSSMSALMTENPPPSKSTILDEFCNAYDTHAKTGTCITVLISGAGKATLKSTLLGITSSATSNSTLLGNALAAYWAAELTALAPHTTVTSDAATKGPAFTSAVMAAVGTGTETSIEKLFTETDTVVKTIIFTGVIPGSPPVVVPATII